MAGKALFLDRDGVVNEEQGYIRQVSDFHIRPGFFDLMRLARQANYRCIIITNQGGIAKGLYSAADLHTLHHYLDAQLLQQGLPPLEVYYCPHHPAVSACLCRKPETLLFQRCLARYRLNASECYMLGDKARDLKPARQLGLNTLLIGEDSDAVYDRKFADVVDAAAYFSGVWFEKE